MSVKKKRTDCKKKAVKKDWIENLVISQTMKLVNDEETIRAIAAMLLDMQERENTNLPLLTEQLKETQRGIDNLLNAIQQGIFTKSNKSRLGELEAAKEELEIKIANEKIAKPKLTEEQILFYLRKFRVLDMSKQSHRQRLIDTFINRIYLYDDKLIITFNHKDGAETITLNDIETALTEQEDGSDLVSSAVPINSCIGPNPKNFPAAHLGRNIPAGHAAGICYATAPKISTTNPRITRITPVARFSVLGVALLAKTAAILAQSRVKTTHRAKTVQSGAPPMVKWETAPVRAVKVMMNTLVPTAVFSS